jgi:hypothetical protein
MEVWLYTILHVVFYITTGIALYGYMDLFVWQYHDRVSGDSLFALVMPTVAAVVTILFDWALGLTISDNISIVIACDAGVFIGTVVATWTQAIRGYRRQELTPEYASFFIVTGFSLLVFLGSVLLLLLV